MDQQLFAAIKGKLIVSCQALEHEPLFGSAIMARMARAAKEGGAVAIRSNTPVDIAAIKAETGLPVVGLLKRDYPDSEVYITATRKEIDELMEAGPELIALDATRRSRPNGETLEELVAYMKERGQGIMADISTLEEALYAESLGVDCVSTTLSGYTPYSRQDDGPDFELLQQAAERLSIPVIAEGKIESPEQAARMLELGAHAVVVGSAITRPQLITARYAQAMEKVQA
ncbi:putative N-acetylmannosamine-6-phosphate 2-epimerase [Paenibacillus sp. J31TS4]|uniref:N-acetylmannosamine-6-phosphate 2-epimerase n=1 Tax=Paenibacillus sp. J31TS4 TaxID=2807195 RepID=UPI001B19D245|nr:N-acetylmannosamine-6-phosphate 2-epimerase [Paenibacillus sp. J31TS4]GIP41452.1 putative N-acetylmannosamine-6-phosphate 2-epimerase [Paenibacillus sp. J31TS4]